MSWNDLETIQATARPVPAAFAEPLERLLDALRPNSLVLLLRVAPHVAPDWLTQMRIDKHLRQALMEPAQTDVWPLLPDVWAISLEMDGDTENPVSSLHIHSLRRALMERLETAWQEEDIGRQGDKETRRQGEEKSQSDIPSSFLLPPSSFSLTPVAALRTTADMEDNITELNLLLDIIVNKQLHAQFQPIVNLRDGQVLGYEALIRGPKGGTLRRPGALFRAAAKARMVSWFDLACQERCFQRAAEQGLKHLLFINMEAEGLSFLDMHDRPLATRARDCGLSPTSIVIEITERQAVDDFPRLMYALNRLRDQGFKIAVDDAGAGYSSLHAIAEIRPDFVKIDRSLVRNLDVNGERRALLSALVQYARNIGTQILGEGSETFEELGTLIDLGVPYGQGYLMGKPADTFRGVSREMREFIQQRQRQRGQRMAGRFTLIGGLARAGKTLPPDAPLADAARSFYKNPSLTSVVIVEDSAVRGLLMRQSLEHILDMARSARMEGLLPEETVAQWMQTEFLRAYAEEPVGDVARQATTRADLSLESDIVVVDGGNRYVGVTPMRVLMEAATTTQENRKRYADPLTGLPNLVSLEQIACDRLPGRGPLALVRIDLTGLAAYNRAYGLPHGDNVVCALARMIQEAARSADSAVVLVGNAANAHTQETFIAHLGGDDFVALTHPDKVEPLCGALMQAFARQESAFYTPDHYRSGGMGIIESSERGGGERRVPLLACVAAGVTNRQRRFDTLPQMLDAARALLRHVKMQPGHAYALDRLPAGMALLPAAEQRKAA